MKNLTFRSNKTINNSKNPKKKTNYEIFRIVCPALNMNLYSYSTKMVRQIKLLFRYFYDNRNTYLSEIKKKHHEKKLKSKEKDNYKPNIRLSASMDKSADYYKKQAYEVRA